MDTKPIRGGSTREAELSGSTGVAWPAARTTAESPMVQGLRRLRRSTTALVGVAIVAVLLVVAIFADVLAPRRSEERRVRERVYVLV